MTATLVLDGFSITLKSLVELLELEEEDDYGILRPTTYAFTSTMKLVLEAYELIGDSFPPASPCTDDEGGIRLRWTSRNPEKSVCLFCPHNPEQPADVYHSTKDDSGVEDILSVSTLVYWLQWFNE
ncbi:MAG: hypothetical protein F6J93_18355 [Oscillatoria sp. SIO1A7]|nr:hypothetical protein [Oscillatoria sp. SIO1A7]